MPNHAPGGANRRALRNRALRRAHWNRWGPFLSERAWGTVREDYSADGDAWDYFPFDHAARRAYRWNEDGLAGISDRHQRICFASRCGTAATQSSKNACSASPANEGNHGEDVKEYYFYLDNTPTHSYMKYLYKYPQAAFPYRRCAKRTGAAPASDPEYELARYRRVCRKPLFRCAGGIRQGRPRRYPYPRDGGESRAGAGLARPAAHRLVPQYAGAWGCARWIQPSLRLSAPGGIELDRAPVRAALASRGWLARLAVHRERNRQPGALGLRQSARLLSRTASAAAWSKARPAP